MLRESINTLSYEYSIAPGGYFHVDTSFTEKGLIKNIIIDQDNNFIKLLTIYPKDEDTDFLLYLEQFPDHSIYRTNHPLEMREHSDIYEVKFK